MVKEFRATVALTVRIAPESRKLLDLVAEVRRLNLSTTIERLIDEEARRLGPKRRKEGGDDDAFKKERDEATGKLLEEAEAISEMSEG